MKKENNERVQRIFQGKKDRRRELAKLPMPEKIRILIELQKLASPLLQARGSDKKPWRI